MISAFREHFWSAFERTVFGMLVLIALLVIVPGSFSNRYTEQFTYLANSFLHGKLYFTELPGSPVDIAWYHNKPYWHLGPFPAVLLMPFVLFFGTAFHQGYLHLPILILNGYLLYLLALKLGIKKKLNALWLSFGYLFASTYLTVAENISSSRFGQGIAAAFVLGALLEYLSKKRMWLIGLLMALAFATRANLILGAAFFLLGILWDKTSWRDKFFSALKLCLPVLAMALLLMLYNVARFDDPWESGYHLQPYYNTLLGSYEEQNALDYTGKLFSVKYLPTNLYFYFLKGLDPVYLNSDSHILKPPYVTSGQYGFSVFLAGPLFLLVFLAPWKEKLVRQGLITAGLILISVLMLYITAFGAGRQFGQRYFVDLLPFLFIPLVRALAPELPARVKALIAISFLFNVYLLYALYGSVKSI